MRRRNTMLRPVDTVARVLQMQQVVEYHEVDGFV